MGSLAGGLNYLKKYLLKGIDLEKADSKVLKTLALCWAYRKRAFSVSGSFRKALSDLITDLHNSNKKLLQTRLSSEFIPEEKFFLLGFVPLNVLNPNSTAWFIILSSEQITAIDKYFRRVNY